MLSKLGRTLILVVAIVCTVSTLALAAEVKLSGTVQNIDIDDWTIMVQTTDGKKMSFKGTGGQVSSLEPGDNVELTAEYGALKSIKKLPAAQK